MYTHYDQPVRYTLVERDLRGLSARLSVWSLVLTHYQRVTESVTR